MYTESSNVVNMLLCNVTYNIVMSWLPLQMKLYVTQVNMWVRADKEVGA